MTDDTQAQFPKPTPSKRRFKRYWKGGVPRDIARDLVDRFRKGEDIHLLAREGKVHPTCIYKWNRVMRRHKSNGNGKPQQPQAHTEGYVILVEGELAKLRGLLSDLNIVGMKITGLFKADLLGEWWANQ